MRIQHSLTMIVCNIIRYYILPCLLVSFLVSCNNVKEDKKTQGKPGRMEMTELNRYLVQKDREIIENYIERKELKMTESPTGLWYCVKSPGNGNLLSDDDHILLNYECSLLDGTKCYSSGKEGLKEIVLGKTKLEQGLYEGLRLLSPGAEAVFILPPFLAYGLIGDGKKIPPRATIVYEIKILPANSQGRK